MSHIPLNYYSTPPRPTRAERLKDFLRSDSGEAFLFAGAIWLIGLPALVSITIKAIW